MKEIIKKNKSIIILAVVASLVLLVAWFSGGTPDIYIPDSSSPAMEAIAVSSDDSSTATEAESIPGNTAAARRGTLPQETGTAGELSDSIENTAENEHENLQEFLEDLSEIEDQESMSENSQSAEDEPTSQGTPESRPTQGPAQGDGATATPTPRPTQAVVAIATPTPRPTQAVAAATPTPMIVEEPAQGSEQESQILGEYHPNMRDPVEPEDMVVGDDSFTVTLEVRVDMILHNMHLLHRDKHELIPPDGVIFPRTEVTAYVGESVFNVLQREMRRNNIHMASRFTPIFNSAYVEAINNLYEFDVGALSGWMYKVNGWFPNFGASRYTLNPGDEIVWQYTVDLGRDLGVDWLDSGQLDE